MGSPSAALLAPVAAPAPLSLPAPALGGAGAGRWDARPPRAQRRGRGSRGGRGRRSRGPALRAWPWLLAAVGAGEQASALEYEERVALARQVQEMYDHAFGAYMAHAFPADELRPLSCDGRRVRERGDLDAILGNYSLTLVDALDSLVVFRRYEDFREAVQHIVEQVSFDVDIEVSTFEANIRLLGGLLSGHQHADALLQGYEGGLLDKAVDLADRLTKAFETQTGLPTSRINLRKGVPEDAAAAVTVAEAGSFLLEFGVLSQLTDDWKYYRLAKRSMQAFWRRRSSLGLIGTAVNTNTGQFQDTQSTTGPGQDSFYEYLLKGYILFDDLELLDMYWHAHSAIEQHHAFEGFTYTVDMFKGVMSNTHLSPLSCVWASLQVLAGDVAGGLRSVLYWYGIWSKNNALPEVFDTKTEAPTSARDSPLRPELAEAVFYLSMALPGDPTVLGIASNLISALGTQSRVKCGFAALADVTTKRLDDRMDSYFLSETLVYLYLAVAPPGDVQQALPWPLGSVVFSTEGHMFPLRRDGAAADPSREGMYPGAADGAPMLTCEAPSPFERVAVQHRCQTKYILTATYQVRTIGQAPMRCRPPEAVVEVRLPAAATDASGDVLSFRGTVASFGPPLPTLSAHFGAEAVPPTCTGKADAANESSCPSQPVDARQDAAGGWRAGSWWPWGSPAAPAGDTASPPKPPEGELGLARLDLDMPPGQLPPFSAAGARHSRVRRLFATRRLAVAQPLNACTSLADRSKYEGRIVIIARGACLFLQKMYVLQEVRAAAALVVNHETQGLDLQVMSCPLQEKGAGLDVHLPAVMITGKDGARLLASLKRLPAERHATALMTAEQ